MLSEDKFYEKAGALFYTQQLTINIYLEELKENLAANQTDKDGKLVLYAGNKEAQHSYIEMQRKGYEVLLLDSS
jgi:molecular chaperone HtpG